MEKIGNDYHIPVLYYETLDNLVINPDGVYIDCTLGGGSHSEGILERLSDKGLLISIDQDSNAIEYSKKRLEKFGPKWKVFKGNFENIDTIAYMAGVDKVDGILMDIGVSSKQLDDPERGFSYRYDVKLDMRMNIEQKISAYDVVNTYSEEQLSKIIFEYGEERYARKIAKLIVEERKSFPIEKTSDLIALIKKHGYDILRNGKNRYYSKEFKLQTINRVLVNYESVRQVAIDIGLASDGILHNWLSKFKENEYNVVEKKKGRKPKSMTKPKKSDKILLEKDKIKQLEDEIIYLKAENEYLKKLRALVQEKELKEKKK